MRRAMRIGIARRRERIRRVGRVMGDVWWSVMVKFDDAVWWRVVVFAVALSDVIIFVN
jgi:hypothetical protein